jgi:putative transcription antitermination factor YqgF
MRVLALDYGSARCGCAVSDASGTIATPLDEVVRPGTRRGLTRVVELVSDLGAELVVVGLPLSMSGGDTSQTTETREFARRLANRVAVPVVLHDERLTTRLAQRSAGAGGGPSRAGEDSRAAAHLLEDWLVTRNRQPAQDSSRDIGSPPHRAPADR